MIFTTASITFLEIRFLTSEMTVDTGTLQIIELIGYKSSTFLAVSLPMYNFRIIMKNIMYCLKTEGGESPLYLLFYLPFFWLRY